MAHYWKQDSEKGYIEDTAEIQYQKFNNLRHSILGFMMGDFDRDGNYVVSPEIKRELILMPKFLVESLDNMEVCQSEIKLDKHISFLVTFEGNRATLSLLEKLNYEANFKLNSGSYSNINEYLLDEVETSGLVNRNVIYQRWNINPFGGNQIDIFNCDEALLEKYFGIVNRFKYLLIANKKLLEKEEELEEVESEYANKMFEILKAYPELEKVVVQQLKETLEEKEHFVCIDEPNFAKTLNEILDKAIETNIDVLPEQDKENFKIERRNAIVETNIKKQQVLDVVEQKQDLDKIDVKYNKSHNAKDENEATIVVLDVDNIEKNKKLETLASDFANKSKQVKEEIKEEVVKEEVNKEKEVIRKQLGEENLNEEIKKLLQSKKEDNKKGTETKRVESAETGKETKTEMPQKQENTTQKQKLVNNLLGVYKVEKSDITTKAVAQKTDEQIKKLNEQVEKLTPKKEQKVANNTQQQTNTNNTNAKNVNTKTDNRQQGRDNKGKNTKATGNGTSGSATKGNNNNKGTGGLVSRAGGNSTDSSVSWGYGSGARTDETATKQENSNVGNNDKKGQETISGSIQEINKKGNNSMQEVRALSNGTFIIVGGERKNLVSIRETNAEVDKKDVNVSGKGNKVKISKDGERVNVSNLNNEV